MQKLTALVALVGLLAVIAWTMAQRDEPTVAADAPVVATNAPGTTTPPETRPILATEAMSLVDLDGWLQTDIDSLDDLRGEVVIVHFWTFSCINCKRTLPNLRPSTPTTRRTVSRSSACTPPSSPSRKIPWLSPRRPPTWA